MKKNSGVSLLETVIATAIVISVAMLVLQLLSSGQIFSGIKGASLQAQEKARIAMNKMVRELTEASSSFAYVRSVPAIARSNVAVINAAGLFEGQSFVFKRPCRYDPALVGGSEITMIDEEGKVVSGGNSGSGLWNAAYCIEYVVINGQLLRRLWAAGINSVSLGFTGTSTPLVTTVLASDIAGVTFQARMGSNPTQLLITVVGRGRDALRNQTVTASVSSRVFFRN